jgi:hypothetical protein
MAEHQIETALRTALWKQIGAAIDMLEKALIGCPDSLWTERVWIVTGESHFPSQFAEFWYLTFHVLVWFDLYLSGVPEEEFAPPSPFIQAEIDSVEALPEQPYSKDQLHAYLVSLRQKCHTIFSQLSEEEMQRTVEYGWSRGDKVSYIELQLYNLRHIQEHAAQLSLFIGQHPIADVNVGWVARRRINLANPIYPTFKAAATIFSLASHSRPHVDSS